MVKRKQNSIVVQPEESKNEETTLPLVRNSDEPIVKKVRYFYIMQFTAFNHITDKNCHFRLNG